jgi:RHS repeat-associated protein
MVVQGIPGLVSRDKPRDLHLIYRSTSQRAQTIAPIQLFIDPLQKAPDSLRVVPKEGAVAVGTTTRYAGLKGSPGGKFVLPLDESAKEYRAVAAEINAPSGQAAIRSITSEVTHFYPGGVTRTDAISQQVVQLYLNDTTATRFGRGWQLAELSRLVTGLTWQASPALVWVDGDGSYSIFTKPGSTWQSPPGETASLVENTSVTNADSARYTILLDNGATVGFRIDGWQAWTSDPIGNRTYYSYTGTGIKRLQYITDPNGSRLEFGYTGGSAGKVETVSIRPNGGSARTAATLKYGPAGRLDTLIIHWGYGVRDTTRFGYATDTTAGFYLTSITDARSTPSKPVVTTFTYDSALRAPSTLTLPPDNIGIQRQQLYRDIWRRAAPRYGKGRGSQPLERTVLISQLMGTSVNPAGFATDYVADAYGGPTFVRRVSPGEPRNNGFFVDTIYRHDDRHIVRDALGRVTKIVHMRDSSSVTDSIMYRYDSRNRLDQIVRNTLAYPVPTDKLDTLTFTYDSVSITTADNPGAWCYRLLTATDGAGGVTTTTYGTSPTPAKCRPAKVVGVALDTTTFSYGSGAFTKGNAIAGRPTTVIGAAGVSTDIGYNASTWNTASYYQPAKLATTTLYYSATSNALGRPDSIIDPEGKRVVFWYDSLGRARYQKAGSGALVPTTYTNYGKGGLVSLVDVFAMGAHDTIAAASPAKQTTRYYYDRLGQTDSVVLPGSTRRIWYYRRDPYGVPTRVYAGNGSYTASGTDWQGRVYVTAMSQAMPSFSVDGLGYFADSYSSGQYNAATALSSAQLSDGQNYTFQYDVKGRQIEASHYEATIATSIRRRGYSRTGQLVADTLTFPDARFRMFRRYEYNRRGQRSIAADTIQLLGAGTLNGDTKGRIEYTYDAVGRLTTLKALAGTSTPTEFALATIYYGRGNRDSVVTVRLNGTGSTLKRRTFYDAAGRVTSDSSRKDGGTPIVAFSVAKNISYNKVDDVLGLIRTTPSASGRPMTYTYSTDGSRRLLSEVETGGLSTVWGYDVFGNRVRQVTGATDTSAFEATDNRLRYRRLTVGSSAHWYWHDHTGSRIGSTDTLSMTPTLDTRMTYTAGGQLAWSFHRNEPGQLTTGFTTTWHWYDATGMREMTEVNQTTLLEYLALSPGAGTQSYYFYDGSDVALVVHRASNGVLTVAKRYLTGGLDGQLAVKNAVGGFIGSLAIISDYVGSVQGAMRPDGNLEGTVLSYSTNAYGQVTSTTGTGGTSVDVGFAGASTPDPKGGFTYMRNRWYDPQTGRFLTQDPIGLAGGVNLYGYASNNPIAFSDPFGLCIDPADPDCSTIGRIFASASAWLNSAPGRAAEALSDAAGAVLGAIDNVLPGSTALAEGLAGISTDGTPLSGGQQAAALTIGAVQVVAGTAAGGRAINSAGRVLGPSGKPMIHQIDKATRKQAKDAARDRGKGAPMHHPTPRRGQPHYHPTDGEGRKIEDGTHYNYPP